MPDRCSPASHAGSAVRPQAISSVDDDAEEQVMLSPQKRARTGHLADAPLSPETQPAAAVAAAPTVALWAQAKDACSSEASRHLVPSPCRATPASSPLGTTRVVGPRGAASAAVSNAVPTRSATPMRQRDDIASPSACDQPT